MEIKFYTPKELAERWHWHVESVRRAIREGRIASILLSRRRLISAEEIERIETSATLGAWRGFARPEGMRNRIETGVKGNY